MSSQYDIVVQLTAELPPGYELTRILNDFALALGWRPNYYLKVPGTEPIANAHLVVEHGLENSAVITFLRGPRRFEDLARDDLTRLLGISYNNLVDWHICVELNNGTVVYNRKDPFQVVEKFGISRENTEKLRSEAFEQILGKKPNPNIKALDDAIISTLSFWKRNLSAEVGSSVPNEAFSSLFNSLIFVRAVEDHFRKLRPSKSEEGEARLLMLWKNAWKPSSLRELILSCLTEDFKIEDIPRYIFESDRLKVFDGLDWQTVYSLLSDFYRIRHTPYAYDFSVMSKHALSRVYEHYVSILRFEQSPQLTFFPPLPEEARDKAYGSVYTPQFIARYFARYLQEQTPPSIYRRMKTADPACGSGIFLRTLMELQCDPTQNGITTDQIESSFQRVFGLDIDQNACQATRLSLALLHLVLSDKLPNTLNVVSDEAIDYYISHPDLTESFDVLMAKPPFVSLDTQSVTMRKRLSAFLGDDATGRKDMYMAFLKMALQMLKPGGFGLFVLPHSFLLSNTSKRIRRLVRDRAWVRCLADLSAIRIFEDSSSYIVLLIFQKKPIGQAEAPPATIIKCQEFVGRALQDALEEKQTTTSFYSVYQVDQEKFKREDWLVLPPTEAMVRDRFESLPKAGEFLEIRAGFVSGADDVFIVSKDQVPRDEEVLFVPFLPDRHMQTYSVPKSTGKFLFYPFVHGQKVQESVLQRRFKKTWRYLCSHRAKLESRLPVKGAGLDWWSLTRPRSPESMMRPKIVTPHLVLMPRFGVDRKGKYAVSRTPFLYPKESQMQDDLLHYFAAVLNSTACFWYISSHSHKYSRGYAMLEPGLLKKVPVPDPTKVPAKTMRKLLGLVDKRSTDPGRDPMLLEKQIDEIVSELYGLSEEEKTALGVGT